MAIDKVWVLAEAGESGPTPLTLELLTEARAVAATVEAVAWGTDTAVDGRRASASTAPPRSTTWATSAGPCPACRWPAAIAGLVAAGDGPDALLVPATYDGRDVAGRLSVKLDRPVLTNVTGLVADGGAVDPAPASSAAATS